MWLELAVILALVLVNGLFAGAEIAIVGVDRGRVRQLVETGSRKAAAVKALRDDPERFFATVQIMITVISATAAAFGGATVAADLEPLLVPYLPESSEGASVAIVVALISYLSLVLGELVPKSLGLRSAESYALVMGPVLLSLSRIATPLVWLLTTSSNVVLRAFGDKTTFTESRLSPNEIRSLVDEAGEVGTLDASVTEITSRALDFAKLTTLQVMIPRTRIVAIPHDATPEQIQDYVIESGHSRLPVYKGSLDNVIGYVLYKDLLPLAWEGRLLVLSDLLRPPFFVLSVLPASELLRRMRENRTHLAFVVDEGGGLSGIVTLDDLIEELVGEVANELHDRAPAATFREADGSVVTLADATVREVNREYGLSLPESEGWSTVGGLCLHLAGRVPRPGDVLRVENALEIVIESGSDRAVTRVRIRVPTPNPSA